MGDDISPRWDVFLSYNHSDATIAERLATKLTEASGLRVFFDRWCVLPGESWMDVVDRDLGDCAACVVLIGPSGLGRTEREEVGVALERRIQKGNFPVIPVLLPGATRRVREDLPKFLLRLTWADLSAGVDDVDGFQALLAGIKGPLVGNTQNAIRSERTSWENYDWLFQIDDFQLAYIPLMNPPFGEIIQMGAESVTAIAESVTQDLPADFSSVTIAKDYQNGLCCRLNSYSIDSKSIAMRLAQTTYEHYLKSNESLDRPYPRDSRRTYRDVFGGLVRENSNRIRPFELSNICGVGLFMITRDGFVVASRHSPRSHVYPGRLTFSASGVMKWADSPDPFSQVIIKAQNELGHQVSLRQLKLIAFGADARKLYFQFGFVERLSADLRSLRASLSESYDGVEIALEPDSIADAIFSNCWEPAAVASLLALCAVGYGWPAVINAVRRWSGRWFQTNLRDEWDYRAWRPEPDMSLRYPAAELSDASAFYVSRVIAFWDRHIPYQPKSVVEVGAGTGRISQELVKRVARLTVVDLCEKMLQLHKERLASSPLPISEYLLGFGQEVLRSRRFEAAICCLVLIHNVTDEGFGQLVSALCESSPLLFVCEDITVDRPTSPRTRLRSASAITKAIGKRGFRLTDEETFKVFDDTLWLARFDKV